MDVEVAKYAIAIAATLFCFWKAYDNGRAEGRYQGFMTAMHDFVAGEVALEGDEIVFGHNASFYFGDPKSGARIDRMRRDEIEFEEL